MNHELRMAIIRTLPFLVVICVLAVLMKRKKINTVEVDIRKPFSWKSYFIWVIVFLAYSLLIEFSLYSLNILEVSKWIHRLSPSIILIFGIIILAPIAEELLFRGLILNLLMKKKIKVFWAIVIQACFFVLLHNFTYENTLSSNIGIVQSFVDAILFGYARLYTKSIYTSITMHMTGNAIAIVERFIT